MHLTITDPAAFADAVGWVARHLPARPSVPVLSALVLDATTDTVTVSAFDYETAALAELDGVHVEQAGKVAVGGAMLAQLACTVHPDRLTVDNNRLELTGARSRAGLPTIPAGELPQLPDTPQPTGSVHAGRFAQAITTLAPMCADPGVLPAMGGIRLEPAGGRLHLYATDRFRIGRQLVDLDGTLAVGCTVPAGPLLATLRGYRGDQPVQLAVTETVGGVSFTVQHAGRVSTFRTIAEEFPKGLDRLFEPGPDELTVTAAELREAVKVAASVSTAVDVTVDPNTGTVQLVAVDGARARLAEWQHTLDADTTTPGAFRINPAYLSAAVELAATGGPDRLTVHYTGAAYKPVVVGAGDRTAVSMPLRKD